MNDSILDAVPRDLAPIDRAHAIQAEAARVGFDWPDALRMIEKVDEELRELSEAFEQGSPEDRADEIGDLLFVLVNLARFQGATASECLRMACDKFERRFRRMENALRAEGKRMEDQSPETLDAFWNQVKRGERGR